MVRLLDLAADELRGGKKFRERLPLDGVLPARISARAAMQVSATLGTSFIGAAAHVGRLFALAPASLFQLVLDEPFHPPLDVIGKRLRDDRRGPLHFRIARRGGRLFRRLLLRRCGPGRREWHIAATTAPETTLLNMTASSLREM